MSKKNNTPSVYAEISRIYHDPAASSLVPSLVQIDFLFDNGSMAKAFLPSDQLTTSGLKKAVPRLRGLPDIRPLVCELNTQFADIMDGTVPNFETFSGLLQPRTGLQRLPNGHSLYVLGDQLIGPITMPVLPRPPVSYHMMLSPIQHPLAALFSELVYCSATVVVPIIFLFATLLRSLINEITSSWQAVLAITGGQGLGKTTLARKITDWICDSQNKPALLYSAGSTPAAIHDTMVTARDLPLVIDDLCLSASPKFQQKYRDLGAQFVREGTNASGISKKAGNQTMSFSCNAGIILTAEFALENPMSPRRLRISGKSILRRSRMICILAYSTTFSFCVLCSFWHFAPPAKMECLPLRLRRLPNGMRPGLGNHSSTRKSCSRPSIAARKRAILPLCFWNVMVIPKYLT